MATKNVVNFVEPTWKNYISNLVLSVLNNPILFLLKNIFTDDHMF